MSLAELQTIPQTKSETETKPEDKAKPVAVPIVDAEEAIKLNENAAAYVLAEMEKREPFYLFYKDVKLDSVCIHGTIRASSTIPDPEKNDYDNCLYALFIELDSYFADKSLNQEMPCEAIIAVPIMKDKIIKKKQYFSARRQGDMYMCRI